MATTQLGTVRDSLLAAGRRLAARGLIAAGEGNLSARLPDGRLLITPAGLRKDELARHDLLVVRPDGTWDERGAGRRPSSDLALHLAVYAARPDVLAYAHAHLPSAMALTMAGEMPDPAQLPETALLIPRLPVVPLMTPGSRELARALAVAFSAGPEPLPGAVLLARHGAVAVGSGSAGAEPSRALHDAVDRLELVDVLCRVWMDAVLLRAARGAAGEP
jgi:L-fuculose-phosphate aldolase